MEEIARDAELKLDSNGYKQARFELYTIEKELLGKLLRKDKLKRLTGIYLVIDSEFLNGRSVTDIAMAGIRGGAKVIQLREKERGARDFLADAMELKDVCAKHDILFIVNDSLEVALATGADGLHVGQDDLPVTIARRLMPIDMLLGVSARTFEEAVKGAADGADYLGVGAIYPTATKDKAGATGPGLLEEIKKSTDLPLVAIGGINNNNIKEVMQAGAVSAAVISAILGAADVEKATRELVTVIEGEHGK
jgi:thiamine-phosphate pyrophosphorylase